MNLLSSAITTCKRVLKTAILFFAIVILPKESSAQDCANATEISLCNYTEVIITSGTGSWAYNGTYDYYAEVFQNNHFVILVVQGSFSTTGLEHIYKFTPAVTGTYSFDPDPQGSTDPVPLNETSSPHYKAFFKPASGGCTQTGWTEIGSYGDGISTATDHHVIDLRAGIEYYFMIDGEAAPASESYSVNFQLCKADAPDCAAAPVITVCTNTQASISLNAGAWDFGAQFQDLGYTGPATPGKELVYAFIPASTGNYAVTVTATNGYYTDYLYKAAPGTCDNTGWKEIASFNAPGTKLIAEQLTQGVTYYFLLDNQTFNTNNQTFQVCKVDVPDCSTAIAMTLCNATSFNIAAGIGAWDFAGTYPVNSVGSPSLGKEKFASFTPGISADYSMEVTSATGGFVNYLYKKANNGCGDTGWIGIAKFNGPGGKKIGRLLQGVTYYFILDNADNATASAQTFKICLTPSPTCSPVTTIGLYNKVDATIPAGVGAWDNYPPDSSLASSTPGKEIFFRFVPPSTSIYHINQTAGVAATFYYKPDTTDCTNSGWQLFPSTKELLKGKRYLVIADQKGIAANTISFEVMEDGYFICPGEGVYFCSGSPYENATGYVFVYSHWYGTDTTTENTDCIDLGSVPSSHYGYTYTFESVVRDVSSGEFVIYDSPIYTLKFRTVWTGAVSTAWNEPGNWSCGAIPDENTDVIIPYTPNKPVIQTNTAVKKLFVGKGASVTVNPNVVLTIKD